MGGFVHLHNHTHYSLLDAACTPEQLIKAALEDDQEAVALTDHGVMFGCMEFYNKAKDKGIKPILGFEAYVANGSRFDKTSGKSATKKKNYFHLLLLAKNLEGYKNLMKLTTLAHTEGFYYKPRIDEELLKQYHKGIIACSGCMNGVVNAFLVNENYELAVQKAKFYQELFGDDFYMELQDHKLPEDTLILRDAPNIAKELGIKLVASNDVHYIKKEHAVAHNVYLNIKDITAANSGQVNIHDLRYRAPEMYFKTSEEMKQIFSDYPEAIANTVEIAEKCDLKFQKGFFMPDFKIPSGSKSKTLADYLVELTYQGLNERFQEITQEIKDRVDYELKVIIDMDFPGYFLIVQDFIRYAKENGIRVGPGRGSVAGSLVAYALGITNVNPLLYDLLFERFLNPDRVSMPDIDIDFSDVHRDKIINYVKNKYGENCVAQIITFGKLSSRAVLKDVGRVIGIHHTKINAITSKIPVVLGKVTPLQDALKIAELKDLISKGDDKMKELIDYSLLLEGFFRNSSTHAAGIVITPGDVSEYVPLYQSPSQKTHGTEIATQYSMKELEKAGLLKMDFLGLRTLSIIDNTLEMIKNNYGIDVDIDKVPLDDDKVYDLFSDGNTLAVFQFESNGMKEYLRQLKPRNIEDITAMNALYRPGPLENIPEFIDRKNNKKKIEYLHPVLEKSLKNTYGIIVYQEQVMQIARDIAGFTLAQADILRKAMGKKDIEVMKQIEPQFIDSAEKNGFDRNLATEIFELLKKFASYGFNKSHSLAYSLLAYQTAWLKVHYPEEFLAANMSAELNDLPKIVQLIEEAKKFNIKVLPPDINRSSVMFTADKGTIYFGLAAIKNVGVSAVKNILASRKSKPFTSFFDFISRVDSRLINKRVLEALVCAGAFDSLNSGHRAALFHAIESALEFSKAIHESENTNMESMFGVSHKQTVIEPKLPIIDRWDDTFRLMKEKEVLGFYISGNPMYKFQPYLQSLASVQLGDKDTNLLGEQVRICAMITEITNKLDKNQKPIAFATVEDFSGVGECVFWSKQYAKFKNMIKEDNVYMFLGKLENDGDKLKVVVNDVTPVAEAANLFAKGYYISIDLGQTKIEDIETLYKLCISAKARNNITFSIFSGNNRLVKNLEAENISIDFEEETVSKLIDIFGRFNVRFINK